MKLGVQGVKIIPITTEQRRNGITHHSCGLSNLYGKNEWCCRAADYVLTETVYSMDLNVCLAHLRQAMADVVAGTAVLSGTPRVLYAKAPKIPKAPTCKARCESCRRRMPHKLVDMAWACEKCGTWRPIGLTRRRKAE